MRLDLRERNAGDFMSGDGNAPHIEAAQGEVLVVDDDTVIAHLLGSLLTIEGYRATVVGDGLTALQRVAVAPPPALVLLDWFLPHASGLEVLDAIRTSSWRTVPVIVVTGNVTEQAAVRAFRAGADDFVTKPFGPAELVARVGRLVRRVSATV